MSRESIEALMDRWESDPDFKRDLRSDPDEAIARTGIVLDEEELAAFRAIDWSLPDEELQARASKSGCNK